MAAPPEPAAVYGFGPYELDARARRLTRNGDPVAVPDRQLEVLIALAAGAGQVVSKDALVRTAWKDVAVTDNSVEQAISGLRRALGQSAGGRSYIETLARRGYRLGVPVTRTVARCSTDELASMLAPLRAFVEGRAALETLERDAIERAREVFAAIVESTPDYAPAHVGLANALALHYEATRTGDVPDRAALDSALRHAHEACRLDPSSAEAWSVLGLAFHQRGASVDAAAAARRATALEPGNWRHHLRFAYVSWGEERLRAAHRALTLLPGLALAHWLAATVYVARQAFAEAERELLDGAAAQDRQPDGSRFRGVGLHLVLGLLRLRQGDPRGALQELTRELAREGASHIYWRQAQASALCGIAGVRLQQGERGAAVEALDQALQVVPGHAPAAAARTALTGDAASAALLARRLRQLREHGDLVEGALAEAVFEGLCGRPDRAADVVYAALEQERTPGSAGWTLPIDPLLQVHAHPDRWDAVLTLVRARAA